MNNFGNPDISTMQALYAQGEWVMEPFDGIEERWSNDFGHIYIQNDGYAELFTNENSAFTINEIVGFAMLRGLISLGECDNCGGITIQPQTIQTPCEDCGFWNGDVTIND